MFRIKGEHCCKISHQSRSKHETGSRSVWFSSESERTANEIRILLDRGVICKFSVECISRIANAATCARLVESARSVFTKIGILVDSDGITVSGSRFVVLLFVVSVNSNR